MKNTSVAILLATYKPNLDFLYQQLESLKRQTYKNISLYILDDSEDQIIYQEIKNQIERIAFEFPVLIDSNPYNLGSTQTFEKLTQWANADYFAYCDQDDVWKPQKIERLVQLIQKEKTVLAYSDLEIIDSTSQIAHHSILKANPTLKHIFGDQCFKFLLIRNSVTGCSMLIDAKVAKEAVPFNGFYIHDHWLALYASSIGNIAYTKEPLVEYRIHENNQIGSNKLMNVRNKNEYIQNILIKNQKRIEMTLNTQRFQSQKNELDSIVQYFDYRIKLLSKRKINCNTFLQFINLDFKVNIFELIISYSPEIIVNQIFVSLNSSSTK